jgi:hypothetical protein
VPATLILLLAAIGAYSAETALSVAVFVNVGLLFVWGVALRQVAGGTWLQILGAGLASAILGLALVLLKVLVH